MADDENTIDAQVVADVILLLNRLDAQARRRLIASLGMLYGVVGESVPANLGLSGSVSTVFSDRASFTEDRSLSPKEFVWQKQPQTAIERAVCLAYYLTHYKGLQQFKTIDISSLNTEAAQVKFSNPTMAVAEATRRGYLVSAGGQLKQLSVIGEQFVRLLPDREAAFAAIANAKVRRPRRKAHAKESETA